MVSKTTFSKYIFCSKNDSRILLIIILLIFLPKNYSFSAPLPSDTLERYAKSVSVGIDTPGSSASGFLIGKKGKKYFFITAGHSVISDPNSEEYWVYSLKYPKKKYRVTLFEKPSEFIGKDIVIGSFYAEEKLDLTLIFPLGEKLAYKITGCTPGYDFCAKPTYTTYQIYDSFHNKRFNKAWKIQGNPIVAGISLPSKSITVPLFRSSLLKMQDRAFNNQQGYEAIYNVKSTTLGMSGSGVFGTRVCPSMMYWGSNFIGTNPAYPGKFIYSESPKSSGVLPNPPRLDYGSFNPNSPSMGGYFSQYQAQYKYKIEERYRESKMYHDDLVNRTKEYPGVIAMHGMSEEYGQTNSRSGIGLGIPLDLFTKFFSNNSQKYGIPNEKEYFKLVYKFCF